MGTTSGNKESKFISDLRRLYKHAALIGAALALICHLVPPEYKAACHAVASLCGANH